MGEETVAATLDLGADIENKIKGSPNDQKLKSKKSKRHQRKSNIIADDSENSNNSNVSNEHHQNNDENATSNHINSKSNGDINKENGDSQQEFCVKSTNKEFKLRLVPLERLLASTTKAELAKENAAVIKKDSAVVRKLLPQRSNRKNYSIIEISSSSSSSNDELSEGETENNSNNISKSTRIKAVDLLTKVVPPIKQPEAEQSTLKTPKTPINSEEGKKNREIEKENTSKPREKSDIPASLKKSTKPQSKNLKEAQKVRPLVRRCVVRIKRVTWPLKEKQQKQIKSNSTEKSSNSKEQLTSKRSRRKGVVTTDSGSSNSEMDKPSGTRKRMRSQSESDSDFEMEKAQEVAHQEENSFDEDNEDDDDDDDAGDGNKTSDSEFIPARKKRVFNRKRSETEDSDFETDSKRKAKKQRRRIKNDSDDDDESGGGKEKQKNKRKDIRKIIKSKDLDVSTKEAHKEEEERRKRIEERQKIYNQIYEVKKTEEITELVLDFDDKTKEPLLKVDGGLLKKLKPHQVTGVKFMWDACFETLQDTVEKPGSGCILAHCMGLGKTLQIVTLVHTLIVNARKTQVERVLIISPLSTLNNWAREFRHWMSFARKKDIEIYDMSRFKDKNMRIFKLKEWFDEGGVCILGYDMYRILSNEKAKGLRKKQREELQTALVDPGPDLVVCDEGHLLKNEKTSISKAVTRMRTKRRIVLTGTPLQNNLKEYYCMIQFIKPNLLGTFKEYLNRFVNPITNGQYMNSTERDIRLMKHRSHILHKMLEGCIQRRDYSVLAPYLPPKHEYVVYTTLSELQQKLYDYYMTTQRDINSSDICGKGARLFQDFQDLRRIWTHPLSLRVNSDIVIRKRLMADDENSLEDFICDDDEEEDGGGGNGRGGRGNGDDTSSDEMSVDTAKSFASGSGGNGSLIGSKPRRTRNSKRNPNNNSDASDDDDAKDDSVATHQQPEDPSEWWKRFVDDADLNNVNHSPKLLILMQLLQQCEAIGDKLLVFSQSLQSLDVIEHFLSLIDSRTNGHECDGEICDFKGTWKSGIDYFRLDGSCSVENREDMCKRFNNPSNLRARLFLISTRAGGLGINLVAANRVVIFDVSWNPSHDTQSIFRVYRFGQEKPCYIYRLIAMGTMEQKVYERQVAKQATAKRVIDEQQISRHYNQSDLQELYTYELMPSVSREIPILPKDRLFAELISDFEKFIFKYHEHDSLLENEESENLSEEDRKAAWSEYEAEKTRATQTAQYISYDRGAYANPSGSVTSNRIFGFRSDVLLQLLNMKVSKDHPESNQNQILQLVPEYLNRLYTEMNNGDPTMYKELLLLNAALTQPGTMYMNPLLYANQDPNAAGYYQAPRVQQQQQPIGPQVVRTAAPGFNANEVYEID